MKKLIWNLTTLLIVTCLQQQTAIAQSAAASGVGVAVPGVTRAYLDGAVLGQQSLAQRLATAKRIYSSLRAKNVTFTQLVLVDRTSKTVLASYSASELSSN